MTQHTNTGIHVLANMSGISANLISRISEVKPILEQTVAEANLHKVGETYHQFEPAGVTGVVLLEESHISIHTWPELGRASLDVYTCGDEGNAEAAYKVLERLLQPSYSDKKIVKR